ncbi:MAG: hypothetical protein P4L87_12610 [Formivibrio sp.]|nr:hypothetical protein [Formivibrio sp.]
MIFDTFEQGGLLLNTNFKEATSKPGYFAYRGDLVLEEGEVGDAAGRRKPPVSAIRQVVALANGEKLTFLAGSLDELTELPMLLEKYAAYITTETRLLMFVVNAAKNLKTHISGIQIEIIALPEGMVWTELTDILGLDKSDFKGQSSTEKVMTVYSAILDHHSKAPELAWDEAQCLITNARRQIHGAI